MYLFLAEIHLPLPILIVTAVAAVVIFQVNNNEVLVLFLTKAPFSNPYAINE